MSTPALGGMRLTIGKRLLALATGGGVLAVGSSALWWLRNRNERPYGPRWIADAPRPRISRGRLIEILGPQPGEHMLEVGPGYGHYSLSVARALGSEGTLEILDVRRALLNETTRRAAALGLTNVRPTQGDGKRLPYRDRQFDAAYLVACLGEIDDHAAAIHELARILRPGGRLVVGESAVDPHRLPLLTIAGEARAAGLQEGSTIGRMSYFARFERPRATT